MDQVVEAVPLHGPDHHQEAAGGAAATAAPDSMMLGGPTQEAPQLPPVEHQDDTSFRSDQDDEAHDGSAAGANCRPATYAAVVPQRSHDIKGSHPDVQFMLPCSPSQAPLGSALLVGTSGRGPSPRRHKNGRAPIATLNYLQPRRCAAFASTSMFPPTRLPRRSARGSSPCPYQYRHRPSSWRARRAGWQLL